jgi:hypothetical protein
MTERRPPRHYCVDFTVVCQKFPFPLLRVKRVRPSLLEAFLFHSVSWQSEFCLLAKHVLLPLL